MPASLQQLRHLPQNDLGEDIFATVTRREISDFAFMM